MRIVTNKDRIVIDQMVKNLLKTAIEMEWAIEIPLFCKSNAVVASLTPKPPGIVEIIPAIPESRKIFIDCKYDRFWLEIEFTNIHKIDD